MKTRNFKNMPGKFLVFSLFLMIGLIQSFSSVGAITKQQSPAPHPRTPDTLWSVPVRPQPIRLVNDLAHILTLQQEDTMERELEAYQSQRGYQIVVLTLDSAAKAYQFYANKVFHSWQIGGKDQRGLLILVDFHYKSIFMARGKGLPGDVFEGSCRRIVNEHMITPFYHQQYYLGLQQAIQDLEVLINPFNSVPQNSASNLPPPRVLWMSIGLILLAFLGIYLFRGKKKK